MVVAEGVGVVDEGAGEADEGAGEADEGAGTTVGDVLDTGPVVEVGTVVGGRVVAVDVGSWPPCGMNETSTKKFMPWLTPLEGHWDVFVNLRIPPLTGTVRPDWPYSLVNVLDTG
ncbi:hypothetical protein [Microlunatus phosphovorus]|uniref:hypothetical protein n=1 Tax=Microlunatus phosphovorus TaxID=29405 RepID=UPI001E4D9078|nr:hypothetical protein [Microlunatus phosphovorus]